MTVRLGQLISPAIPEVVLLDVPGQMAEAVELAARLRSKAIWSSEASFSLVIPMMVAFEASASKCTKCCPWST
jgi:hypothetical protein